MGRSSKKNEIVDIEAQAVEETNIPEQVSEPELKESVITDKIPPRVENLMRLYPQYEEFWVTPNGFVHPAGASSYLTEGATLYKNIYFNKPI